MATTRLILVGGFLGAGKTTLLAQAAERLARQGKRVGLVANDQAADLVDTELLKETGLRGRRGRRRLLLLPIPRHDRRHGAIGPRDRRRRAHRRAGGKLHRPVGHRAPAAQEAPRAPVRPGAVFRAGRREPGAGARPLAASRAAKPVGPLSRQRALHLREATRRGRPDRAEQGRPALGGRAGGA